MKKVKRILRNYIHHGVLGDYPVHILGINALKDTSIVKFDDNFKIEVPNDALRK